MKPPLIIKLLYENDNLNYSDILKYVELFSNLNNLQLLNIKHTNILSHKNITKVTKNTNHPTGHPYPETLWNGVIPIKFEEGSIIFSGVTCYGSKDKAGVNPYTRNGELFTDYSPTAACNILPYGSIVKITNLGVKHFSKSTRVIINDVGDFGPGKANPNRIIDLTYAAIEKISDKDVWNKPSNYTQPLCMIEVIKIGDGKMYHNSKEEDKNTLEKNKQIINQSQQNQPKPKSKHRMDLEKAQAHYAFYEKLKAEGLYGTPHHSYQAAKERAAKRNKVDTNTSIHHLTMLILQQQISMFL